VERLAIHAQLAVDATPGQRPGKAPTRQRGGRRPTERRAVGCHGRAVAAKAAQYEPRKRAHPQQVSHNHVHLDHDCVSAAAAVMLMLVAGMMTAGGRLLMRWRLG